MPPGEKMPPPSERLAEGLIVANSRIGHCQIAIDDSDRSPACPFTVGLAVLDRYGVQR